MTKIIDGSKLLRAIARSAAVNGATDTAEDLDLLAAAWEADQTKIAIYEGRHPAQLGPDGREMSPRHRFTGDGICIRCGSDVESDTGCVEELRAALDALRRAAENVINTVSHAKGCTVVSRSCNCWKARLRAALRQPGPAGGEARP